MFERRGIQRTRVLKGAKIILSDRTALVDCTVHNLTNVGASVHIPSTMGIPDVFALSFDCGRSIRQCQVMWRAANMVGVAFC
jgi:hypothetical protein